MATAYQAIAPFYDLLSGELPVYRSGRVRAVELLALHRGDQVLDVGCGTGLNFPLLRERVGAEGVIVGIDASTAMLRQARRRARRAGWDNIVLIRAELMRLDPDGVRRVLADRGAAASADAVIATYVLSLLPAPTAGWTAMLQLCRPGGQLAVVDMQEPEGPAAVFAPLARLACRLGGSDISAHPWRLLERDATDVRTASARGGHLQIRVGIRTA